MDRRHAQAKRISGPILHAKMNRATTRLDRLDRALNVVGVVLIIWSVIQLVASIADSNWHYARAAAISLVALSSVMLLSRTSPRRGSPLMWIVGAIIVICGALLWFVR
jgi:hypothetical protein